MAAAEQLPPKLRRTLAERLLAKDPEGERMVVVRLQRLSPAGQERLAELLDKNSEGQLTRAQKSELKELGAQADQVMLRNSKALAQALRPDLFDAKGRPIRSRFRDL